MAKIANYLRLKTYGRLFVST